MTLEEIDPGQISPEMKVKIKELLDKKTPENLQADIKLAPAKINNLFFNMYLKNQGNA
jgi:hypothetical protein